jgi:pilus assembly protein Flp/PilA
LRREIWRRLRIAQEVAGNVDPVQTRETHRSSLAIAGCGTEQPEPINMKNLLSRFVKDESGATAIEYGLIAALIAVAIIVALGILGNNVRNTFQYVGNSIGAANTNTN